MIVEDFICLGRTVPEESKKYGHKVCMAGFSQELNQFVRVYPLPVQNALKMRNRYTLSLQRNADDSRHESWKLTDRIALYESSDKCCASDIEHIVKSNVSPSIAELNKQRRSLGFIKPDSVLGEFKNRNDCSPLQMELFAACDDVFGANAINTAPYLRFTCGESNHKLQLREWGCYEFVRKNPSNIRQLWNNLRLDQDVYLFVGNMANYRNSWLVISVFSFAKKRDQCLLDLTSDQEALLQ